MIRVVAENVLLFLLPTAVYLGYVLLTRRDANSAGAIVSEAPLVWLFLAGAGLVFATLAYYAANTTGGTPQQVYVPPHMENGKIVPGHFK